MFVMRIPKRRKVVRVQNPRTSLAAALLSLLVASVACITPGMLSKPRDKGGFYVVLAVKPYEESDLERSIARVASVIEQRCDFLEIYCKAERQGGAGSNRLMLRVSTTQPAERVKSVLLSEGMELRPVVSTPYPAPLQTYPTLEAARAAAGTESDVRPYAESLVGRAAATRESHGFLVVERKAIVTGEDVRQAYAATTPGDESNYDIRFMLRPDAAERFGRWTGANVNRYLAVILDGEVRSAPFIKSQITDSGQITGRFTRQQAEDVALVLRSGNLPAPVEQIEEGTYKP